MPLSLWKSCRGWVEFFMMTTKKCRSVVQNEGMKQSSSWLHANTLPLSQTTIPAFPPGLLPLPQSLPAPQHSQHTCSRNTPGTPELREAQAGYLIPKTQGMLQRNHWSNQTVDRVGVAELHRPVPFRPHAIPAAPCWEGQS